jgi:Flp pilus assembly protein TadD
MATPRPTAWFLHRGARRFGPLEREELRGWFAAGMVGSGDKVSGPDWDDAVSAIDAASRLGCELRPTAVTEARLAPSRRELVFHEDHDAGWFAAVAWAAVLFAVQVALLRPHPPGLAAWLGEAAWRFGQVAVPCALVVGGVLWLRRGTRPGPYGPLLAMSAVYAALGVRAFVGMMAVPDTPAVAVHEVHAEFGAGRGEAIPQEPVPPEDVPAPASAPGAEAAPPLAATPVAPAPAPVAAVVAAPRPVDPDPWQTRAYRLQQARDWNGLRVHATAWTQAEPDRALAWHVLGSAQKALREDRAAIASLERALALGSDDVRLLQALAVGYYDAGDGRKAISMSQRLIEADPQSAIGYGILGRAMSDIGEVDEAIGALERATTLAPGKRWYWTSLALAYRRGGYVDKAKAAQLKASALR